MLLWSDTLHGGMQTRTYGCLRLPGDGRRPHDGARGPQRCLQTDRAPFVSRFAVRTHNAQQIHYLFPCFPYTVRRWDPYIDGLVGELRKIEGSDMQVLVNGCVCTDSACSRYDKSPLLATCDKAAPA